VTARAARRSLLRALAPFWETDRSLVLLLGMLLAAIFVLTPVAHQGQLGTLLFQVVLVLLILSGIAAVARTRAWLRVLGSIAALAIGARGLALFLPSHEALVAETATSLVFWALLAFVVGERVLREGPINHHRIAGAIAVYLLIGVLFAGAFELVYLLFPDAFLFATEPRADVDSDVRFVYFSFVTLTTVGYGDVTAVSPGARSLAMLEALIGQLFPAVLIARLVGLSIRG
jgi:voltage-gated potassium channel Kch